MALPKEAYGTTARTSDPAPKVDHDIRCNGRQEWEDAHGTHKKRCDKLLARFAARPWEIMCPRCKTVNKSRPVNPVETAV